MFFRNSCLATIGFFLCAIILTPTHASGALDSLILQGILDLDVPSGGSDGKALHFLAVEDVDDLSQYGVGTANNGGGTDGQEYTFPAQALDEGQHLLLARSTAAMSAYFGACIAEFGVVLEASSAVNQNGDDAIEWYFDSQDWLETSIKTLQQHTDREIVVRDKPMNPQVSEKNGITTLSGFNKNKQQKPLAEDLADAWAVVTFNSSVAIDAVCEGIPVFCGKECSAYQVAEQDLSKIETPRHADREPCLWNLAYSQFTLDEMSSGYAYDVIS